MSAPAFELTAEQRAAVETRDRDVFCEAGAGSGKTRVLVERYCAAVADDGVDIDAVLAFTFTERAAAELRRRVRRELMRRSRAARDEGDSALGRELATLARATERSWVMTIHGFCRRLLAAHPLAAGLDPRFRVLDEAESARLRQRAITEALATVSENATDEITRALAAYRPYRMGDMAVGAHERLRSQGMAEPRLPAVATVTLSPKKTKKKSKQGSGGLPAGPTPAQAEAANGARAALEALVEEFGRRYRALKRERSSLDFADLELEALALLQRSEPVAVLWRGRFAHVMVDEFQDTNHVQLELVQALRGPDTHLFVVGDEQQSIYRFRNADLEVFRAERARAEADPGTAMLPLRGNFRSTSTILSAVNALGSALIPAYEPLTGGQAGQNAPVELLLTKEGKGKDQAKWAEFEDQLEPPTAENNKATVAEARALAQRLRTLVDAGEITRGETVVLLRAFTHVDAFEEALARAGLDPYVVGGRGYWSQQQVEDLIRLLGVIGNPLDDEMLFGALASPAVSVSPDALWLLRAAAAEGNHVWPTVAWRFGGSGREPGDIQAEWLEKIESEDGVRLERFCAALAGLRAAAPVVTIEELIERAMDAFDYDLELLSRRDGVGRMANVRKLMRLARQFESNDGRDLAGFLAAADASTRRDEREGMAPVTAEAHDGVRVMTVHAAKGLEFPVVAVPDLARGLAAGHWSSDVVINLGRGDEDHRFGMRLAFPTEESLGLWELYDLQEEESNKASEEGARLVYVAATRAERRLILSGVFKDSDLAELEEPGSRDSPIRRFLPTLAEGGWGGADAQLESPGLAIRVSGPGAERAAELAERMPRRAEQTTEAGDTASPLLETGPRPVPVGHLSYTSLADFERCGYRFYAERVLGLAPGALTPPGGEDVDELEEGESDLDAGAADERESADRRARSLAFGNAVHAALEWSARNGWELPPDEHFDALFAAAGPQSAERARRLIDGWLESGLLAELRSSEARPEVPFALPLGGTIVRGKIDLLAKPKGGPVVVDFKTDAIGAGGVEAPGEHYRAQRELYALVAAEAAGTDSGPVRAIHLFLEEPGEPVVETMGPLEIDAARERLAGLVRRMRAGDYAPTDEPSHQVCFGCPAAWNLCPHPKWSPRT